jgi:hypothetical protein
MFPTPIRESSYPLGGNLEKFVDEGLVRLVLLGRKASEPSKQAWSNANSDEPLGVSGLRSTYAPRAPQLFIS